MRVLVAEDERALADLVAAGLRAAAMAVDVCYDGLAAQERLAVHDYDVLVLDRDLPGIHGDVLCREVVESACRTRVLMLTAAAALGERVGGLELGADDYVTKPFEYPELLARVRALGRRTQAALPPVLTAADLVLDPGTHSVTRRGLPIRLAPKEFAVLETLLRAGGAVVSAEQLLEQAWDECADPFTAAVRVAMSKLRGKLGDPQLIETVPGTGYRIAP
ncbi:response regulator transcription factor [Amycolatopsis jejuensis]|uniref:response regulator transcription factor n=1 Tax=Amycolatopsis jejuensis TaxID=330084 RepID=UPI000527F2D9|nr:response regulator transcription factor [Amycolatopsis jejuensis]